MPQFDTFSFLSQLFWVFLFFGFLHIALLRWVLPAIAISLKVRRKLIQQDVLLGSETRAVVSIKGEPLLLTCSSVCKEVIDQCDYIPTSSNLSLLFDNFARKVVIQHSLNETRLSVSKNLLIFIHALNAKAK